MVRQPHRSWGSSLWFLVKRFIWRMRYRGSLVTRKHFRPVLTFSVTVSPSYFLMIWNRGTCTRGSCRSVARRFPLENLTNERYRQFLDAVEEVPSSDKMQRRCRQAVENEGNCRLVCLASTKNFDVRNFSFSTITYGLELEVGLLLGCKRRKFPQSTTEYW
jgi:hypothetical protein